MFPGCKPWKAFRDLSGKAREKYRVYRTGKRRNPKSGDSYAWIVKSTAMVNQYYFSCVDRDFGPFFLKLCSYLPYRGKLRLNGHKYAKPPTERAGIEYEALHKRCSLVPEPRTAAEHMQRTFRG
jgi:hypothetical protein